MILCCDSGYCGCQSDVADCHPATSTSVYIPPPETSEYTPPPETSVYTPPPETSSIYTPPPETSSVYTPPPETSSDYIPPPETSSEYTPPYESSTSQPSSTPVPTTTDPHSSSPDTTLITTTSKNADPVTDNASPKPSTNSLDTAVGPIPNPTDTPGILSVLQSVVPGSLQTNAQAACFLATSSNPAYSTPSWYGTLPPAAQSYFGSVNTNFASCTGVPNITSASASSGSGLSGGEKAGVAIGAIGGVAILGAVLFWILTKLGIIGAAAAGGSSAAATVGGTSAANAAGGSSAAPPANSGWNGTVDPGWNGVVNPNVPPPGAPAAPTGHGGDMMFVGAIGRRNSDDGTTSPVQAQYYGQGQGQSMYPDHVPTMGGYHSPGSDQYQYGYPSNYSSSPVYVAEAGGGGGNVHEAVGERFSHQPELASNPRYEMQGRSQY
ncbi:hypothetical protein BDV96DRAFT_217684 [Lophiotrema nucula]|uniref:Uncharacterized protein n=1 Tax=Lophiotrema nucula TaxID=690887 RepID=A0A6A5ZS02_9PLEO|nr:hypothetical protein BDV96DRAFT_217684 [Lophiotrema nucula]